MPNGDRSESTGCPSPELSSRVRAARVRPRLLLIALCASAIGLLSVPLAQAATPYAKLAQFGDSTEGGRYGVAVDPSSGGVYVTNSSACSSAECLVDKFDSTAGFSLLSRFGSGTSPYSASGVTVDPASGHVYVVDGQDEEIQSWSPTAGPLDSPLASFPVTGAKGFLERELGLGVLVQTAVDASGNVYFPNPGHGVVQVFEPGGALKETIEGGAAGAFSEPRGVALDSEANVYVADNSAGEGARVVRIDHETGARTELVPKSAGAQSVAVAVDTANNDVFVGMHSESESCGSLAEEGKCFHVVIYSPAGAKLEEFGAGQIRDQGFTTQFGFSDQLAIDPATHQVYVTEGGTSRVLVFARVVLPLATTKPADPVSASAATLNGEVNPNGGETFCHFEWGPTVAYANSTPCQPELVGEGIKAKPVAAAISGLEGNTTYHFRLVAATPAGQLVRGEDQEFTTPQVPPTVSGVSVAKLTQSNVTFKATVNPQHLDTTYYFNYGPQPFADAVTCAPSVPYASAPQPPVDLGAGSEPEAVELDLASASVVLHPGMASRTLSPNTTYRFQIVATNAAGTTCQPESTFTTLPPAPQATSGSASATSQTQATLNGTVIPGSFGPNSDTRYHFEYGPTPAYGASAPAPDADAGMGTSPVPASAVLTGLLPNTTYHYRLVASNAIGNPLADPALAPQLATGADRTFSTLPPAPFAGLPSQIGATGLTLNGSVEPSGSDLHYRFDYGPSDAYGQSTPIADAGSGATVTPVSAELGGLTPGATYHYRLAAIGPAATTFSADRTFTLYVAAPEASTGAATALTPSGATVSGSLDPHGAPATYRFRYGTTSAYGSSSAATAGSGAVSTTLSGLAPSTTYHYRLLAASAGGIATGADRTFTTAAPPVASAPPAPAKPATCRRGFVRRHGKCVKKPCRRGFVRRHGKCVKKHQKKRPARPAKSNRRSAR